MTIFATLLPTTCCPFQCHKNPPVQKHLKLTGINQNQQTCVQHMMTVKYAESYRNHSRSRPAVSSQVITVISHKRSTCSYYASQIVSVSEYHWLCQYQSTTDCVSIRVPLTVSIRVPLTLSVLERHWLCQYQSTTDYVSIRVPLTLTVSEYHWLSQYQSTTDTSLCGTE